MVRKSLTLAVALSVMSAVATSSAGASGAEGALDTSFGAAGQVLYGVASSPLMGHHVAVQADGKIVIAGQLNTADIVVARFETTGVLDSGFGTAGQVLLDVQAVDDPVGLEVLTDGSILVGSAGGGYFAVVKLDSHGVPDATFGVASDDCPNPGMACVNPTGDTDVATSMAVQADGKIVMVGTSGSWPNEDYVVARFTSAGVLDTGFGDNVPTKVGVTMRDFGDSDTPRSVTFQPDGKILVGGDSGYSAVVARFSSTGVIDGGFGTAGLADIGELGGISGVRRIAVQPDGRIVAGGQRFLGGTRDFFLARLTSTGVLDTTFGDGSSADGDPAGVEIPSSKFGTSDLLYDMAVQRDGKIVAAGYTNVGGYSRAVATRYLANGTVDTSFNGTGHITIATGSGGAEAYVQAWSVAVAPDNSIVLGGRNYDGAVFTDVLMRLNVALHMSTLSSLSSSTGSLGFAASTSSYGVDVSNSVKLVSLTPVASDSNATISVKGQTTASGVAASVSLAPGVNVIPVVVTAQDGTTSSTYTVTVTRAPATLKKNRTMTARAALASVDKTIPRGARVSMGSSTAKVCRAGGTSIKGLKAGVCRVRISVTPKKTRVQPRPKAVVSVVTIRVTP